jgi:Zn-dependent M28 family amino/carboxypeptidase
MNLFVQLFPAAPLSHLQRRHGLGIVGPSTHALEAKVLLAAAIAKPKKAKPAKNAKAKPSKPGKSNAGKAGKANSGKTGKAKPAAGASDNAIKSLLTKLSIPKFSADVATLAKYPNRFSTSQNYVQASDWASQQLAGAGLKTNFQSITVNGKPSRNVIGTKVGTDKSGKEILVTAHLDSINTESKKSPEQALAPGADDNASGSAGVLQIARALKNVDTKHTLRFILFGGEEQFEVGSKHYVSQLSAAQKSKIDFVINMDMIGSKNTKNLSTLVEGSDKTTATNNLVKELVQAGKKYTTLQVSKLTTYSGSDHAPFLDAKIPAVTTWEGDYEKTKRHTTRDTVAIVNPQLANEILKMNLAYIASKTVVSP